MMKKTIYLIAAVLLAASCGKETGGSGGGNASYGPEFPSEAAPGTEITVTGLSLSEDAVFVMTDSEGGRIEPKAKVGSIGAKVRMPSAFGKYGFSVEQGGQTIELGYITLTILGLSVPESAAPRSSLEITGRGFVKESEIILKSSDSEQALEVKSVSSSAIVVTVPDIKGVYSLYVRQEGTEMLLSDALQIGAKVMTKFSMGSFGSFDIKYDEKLNPVSFNDYSITIRDGGIYEFSSSSGESLPFSFTVEDGRIVSYEYGAKNGTWTYTSNGYLAEVGVEGEKPHLFEYRGGNFIGIYGEQNFWYDNPRKNASPFDVLLLNAIYGTILYDDGVEMFVAATMLRLTGKPTASLPSKTVIGQNENGEPQFGNIKYEFDGDYVTKYNDGSGFVFTYEYK